jgi:hypothetical protein
VTQSTNGEATYFFAGGAAGGGGGGGGAAGRGGYAVPSRRTVLTIVITLLWLGEWMWTDHAESSRCRSIAAYVSDLS